MKITELLDLLEKSSPNNVTQSMLSKAWGITRQSVNNRIRNNSEITISELKKAEDFFGVNLMNNISSDIVNVDYYPEVFASCGPGTITFSEEKEKIEFHKSLILNYSPNKQYSMIHAKGDSMTPYINDGDKLIIEHGVQQITDNKVYVFCYDSEIFVKRLCKNFDEIVVKSDNPSYSPKIIKGENINNLQIIGQIVGIVRDI